MKKETENLLNKYLEQINEALEYLPKKEREDRLNTVKNHIIDAIEDQKGQLPESEIIERAIKELGLELKEKRTIKQVLLDFLGYGIIGLFILFLDWVYIFPTWHFNASIPYFVIVFSAAILWEVWYFTIKPRLPDTRYNLIVGAIFYPIFIVELVVLKLPELIPFIGILVYGIVLLIVTIVSIVAPGEVMEKQCPKCKEFLPQKAKFCMMCGEEFE